jgi:RNA polymerase sigma-70 factor, ECF subfamily
LSGPGTDKDEKIDLDDLAARAKRHEPLAFAQMFDFFFEKLRRFAYYQTGDLDRAQDIAAEVIKTAIENIDRFEDRGGMLNAWLYGIARNLVLRYQRERGLRQEVSFDDVPPITSSEQPEEEVIRDAGYSELYRAISRLPAEQREVIVLRYIEGYRTKTVAMIIGKNPGTARQIQHRAILALKREMGFPEAPAAAARPGAPGEAVAAAQGDQDGLESSNAG